MLRQKYMARKQEYYKDGKDTTPEQTTQRADNRFKNQKLKNKWNVPSVEEKKILALQSEVKAMKHATTYGKKRKENTKKRREKREKVDKAPKDEKNKKPKWFLKSPTSPIFTIRASGTQRTGISVVHPLAENVMANTE